jgi:hypothetical protein
VAESPESPRLRSNPLLVGIDGAVALDARVVAARNV